MTQTSIQTLFQQAKARYQAGDKRGAERLLRQIIAQDPNLASAWYGLALCVDDPEEQRVYLKRALALKPDYPQARARLERLKRRQAREGRSRTRPQAREWLWVLGGSLALLMSLLIGTSLLFAVSKSNAARATSQAATQYALMQKATQVAQRRAAQATARACKEQFYDSMLYLLSRFFRQQDIAERTPRIMLAEQIARLEDIRTEAWNIPTKDCSPRVHARLMDYMDKSIASYKAFLGDEDAESAVLWIESLKALAKLDDEVIRDGHPGGLLPLFRAKGYFYWEGLDDPKWKQDLYKQ
ncbi:MAG: tetratricopeptide repeat protein [Chloroflexi bacterium]|nr:tetratricopeptide repeat protein [Chloroflexota bacterium]